MDSESSVFFFFRLDQLPNLKVITFAFGDEIEIGGAGDFKLPVFRGEQVTIALRNEGRTL